MEILAASKDGAKVVDILSLLAKELRKKVKQSSFMK